MKHVPLLSLILATTTLTACLDSEDDVAPDDGVIGTTPAALSPWTAPRLKWILHATPGVARLARLDPATGVVSTLVTHTFADHWRAISVAGNKLLWQRADTGEVSLWTIDQNGGFVRHVSLTPPADGWRARSIALEDDGACPAPTLANRRYVVTFEGPATLSLGQLFEPDPIRWTFDDTGRRVATGTLAGAGNLFATIIDFRPSRDGRWALLTTGSAAGAFDLAYYLPSGTGFVKLRTDHYTAGAGLVGCTLHPGGVGLTNCASSFTDRAAGTGAVAASFQIAQDSRSNQFANTLLWSRADGTAQVFALDPLGEQTSAPTALTPPAATFPAVSLGGWDESPGFTLLCDHRPPPIPTVP